ELAGRMHVPGSALVEHVEGLRQDLKSARKELAELRLKLAQGSGAAGAAQGDGSGSGPVRPIQQVGDARVAVRRVEGLDAGGLRQLADQLRKQVRSGVVALGTV